MEAQKGGGIVAPNHTQPGTKAGGWSAPRFVRFTLGNTRYNL